MNMKGKASTSESPYFHSSITEFEELYNTHKNSNLKSDIKILRALQSELKYRSRRRAIKLRMEIEKLLQLKKTGKNPPSGTFVQSPLEPIIQAPVQTELPLSPEMKKTGSDDKRDKLPKKEEVKEKLETIERREILIEKPIIDIGNTQATTRSIRKENPNTGCIFFIFIFLVCIVAGINFLYIENNQKIKKYQNITIKSGEKQENKNLSDYIFPDEKLLPYNNHSFLDKSVYVKGYYRKNGTSVRSYSRSRPQRTR